MAVFVGVLTTPLWSAGCGDQAASAREPNELVALAADVTPVVAAPVPSVENSADAPTAKLADLTLPPISTFVDHCARCHGPEGMFYAGVLSLSGDALREKVRRMMHINAGLQPTEADIDAMVAYHVSIRLKRPFACITNAASVASGVADALRGEVSPQATLNLSVHGETAHEVTAPDLAWQIPTPPPNTALDIVVSRDGESCGWSFPERPWPE